MQRGANSACRKSCTQNLHAMARGMHVALADGPARPVTIRYLIIIYDIYIISIRTVCNAGTVFFNTELAGRAGACMHATQYVHM